MLNNRFAGDKLDYLDILNEHNITMNAQIVLCKNINDKDELDYTLEQMIKYIPNLKSCSVVPAGLTKYREGLCHIEPYTSNDAKEIIKQVESWQDKFLDKFGFRFVHIADEFYMMSDTPIPPAENYDGYPQIENGVGMTRSFLDEFHETLEENIGDDRKDEVSVITGELFYKTSLDMSDAINKKYPNIKIHIYNIINDFFGHSITVTGLLTGQDIIAQLKDKELGNRVLVPQNTLKAGEDVFLDDISLEELKCVLQTKPVIVKSNGKDFIDKVIGENNE